MWVSVCLVWAVAVVACYSCHVLSFFTSLRWRTCSIPQAEKEDSAFSSRFFVFLVFFLVRHSSTFFLLWLRLNFACWICISVVQAVVSIWQQQASTHLDVNSVTVFYSYSLFQVNLTASKLFCFTWMVAETPEYSCVKLMIKRRD